MLGDLLRDSEERRAMGFTLSERLAGKIIFDREALLGSVRDKWR
jgi:hypothetical protein